MTNTEYIRTYILKKIESEIDDLQINVIFSGRNFNISLIKKQKTLTIRIGRRWKNISEKIIIGGIELLLKKIFKGYEINKDLVELYDSFIKNLSDLETVKYTDDRLKHLYEELNLKYFNNELSETNLIWKGKSKSIVATYNYLTNTIKINEKFKNASDEVLKYILYHEMLHKYLKFHGTERKIHHTKQFTMLEKSYPNAEKLEKEIKKILKNQG
ncbi:MAG: SprT-like domain-containing protein [Candidatus Woesearchaeota archaeon]